MRFNSLLKPKHVCFGVQRYGLNLNKQAFVEKKFFYFFKTLLKNLSNKAYSYYSVCPSNFKFRCARLRGTKVYCFFNLTIFLNKVFENIFKLILNVLIYNILSLKIFLHLLTIEYGKLSIKCSTRLAPFING